MIVLCISFLFVSITGNLRNQMNKTTQMQCIPATSCGHTESQNAATICLKLRLAVTVLFVKSLSLLAAGATSSFSLYLSLVALDDAQQLTSAVQLMGRLCRHWNWIIPIRHVHFPFVSFWAPFDQQFISLQSNNSDFFLINSGAFQNTIIMGLHLKLDRSIFLPISCYVWWYFNRKWQPVIYSFELQKDRHSLNSCGARPTITTKCLLIHCFHSTWKRLSKIFVCMMGKLVSTTSAWKRRVNRFKVVSFSLSI